MCLSEIYVTHVKPFNQSFLNVYIYIYIFIYNLLALHPLSHGIELENDKFIKYYKNEKKHLGP